MARTTQAVLGALGEVAWDKLEHAYGPADDVPELIRALCSHDASERESALKTLNGNVLHQGSVWQVTPFVARILVKLLVCEDLPDKVAVLNYLCDLVSFLYPPKSANEYGFDPETHVLGGGEDPHEFAPQLTRLTVATEFEALIALYESKDPKLRLGFCLISAACGIAAKVDRELISLTGDCDITVRIAAWRALLLDHSYQIEPGIAHLALDGDDEPQWFMVELSKLLYFGKLERSEATIDRIFTIFEDAGDDIESLQQLPWYLGRVDIEIFCEICSSLDDCAEVDKRGVQQRLANALQMLFGNLHVRQIPTVLGALFATYYGPVKYANVIAKPGYELRNIKEVPTELKAVLAHLAKDHALWPTDSSVSGIARTLKARQFPDSRESLANYLGEGG